MVADGLPPDDGNGVVQGVYVVVHSAHVDLQLQLLKSRVCTQKLNQYYYITKHSDFNRCMTTFNTLYLTDSTCDPFSKPETFKNPLNLQFKMCKGCCLE